MSRKTDLSYLHDLVVRLDDRLDELVEISVKQQAILEEHQRRSLANEKAVELLAQELKPVQQHVQSVNAVIKFLSVVGAIIIFLVTIWQGLQS